MDERSFKIKTTVVSPHSAFSFSVIFQFLPSFVYQTKMPSAKEEHSSERKPIGIYLHYFLEIPLLKI